MGGSWERMIVIKHRILDYMLMDFSSTKLTDESFTTFLEEVHAIFNSRPLVPVSTNPEPPAILTSATFLTQKLEYVLFHLDTLKQKIYAMINGNKYKT